MSESKHTPGPWRVAPSGLTVVAGEPDPSGGWPHGHAVAATERLMSPCEREANARLIAAAPDLLRVCEQVLVALSWESVARALGHEDRDRITADISAAVAKAKGE